MSGFSHASEPLHCADPHGYRSSQQRSAVFAMGSMFCSVHGRMTGGRVIVGVADGELVDVTVGVGECKSFEQGIDGSTEG